ncbi:MAG: S9 family peptidase, partial [Flavisolibacter sp.]|nr:S9 family peptidase [Flavisolibacter sp.]
MSLKHFLLITAIFVTCHLTAQKLQPPIAKKASKVFTEHGNNRTDDYYWMNTPDSATINYLKAENAYVEAYLKHTEPLQKKIYDELVARIEQRYVSLPEKENGYWYYTRYEEGKQYPSYYRRKGTMAATEELMLDANALATGHQIFLIRNWAVSRDNQHIAYATDTSGDRRSLLQFKNLGTGQVLPERIVNVSASLAWANDGKTIYYVLNDPTVRAYKVMQHQLGADPANDKEIYTEKENTYSVYLSPFINNRYIFVISRSTDNTEARYIDANNPGAPPVLIQARTKGLEYYPTYYEGDVFHIYTNKEAKNFKYVAAPITDPGVDHWKDVIPHQPDKFLQRVYLLKDYMIAQTREKGLVQITVTHRKSGQSHKVAFSENAYVANMSLATDDNVSDSIRYNYTSLTTPATDYMYNLKTRAKKLLKQQKVGGGYNAANYTTDRIWATATDGTKI